MKIQVLHNGDDAFIAWRPVGFIPDCRGFAIYRRRNGVEEIVSTWVGFEDDKPKKGERRASTNWPIQKYHWTDYMAAPGDRLEYRVVPMVGPDKNTLRADTNLASAWTAVFTMSHEVSRGIEVYFNRGIVASQWVSRRLGITGDDLKSKKLRTAIATPGDELRGFLYGPLGERLIALLKEAAKKKREVYAALYELHDHELESLLLNCGKRAHVVLANGSVKSVGEDQNQEARKKLAGKVDLHDRFIAPRALGHNKFLVVCDDSGKPRWVWTGSQNWTMTGLCTQANNSVLIDNYEFAKEFVDQWTLLKAAGDATPASLRESNSNPRDISIIGSRSRIWFTPTVNEVDLDEAKALVSAAKEGLLFLMFNPGPKDTLLNKIIETARKKNSSARLYIKGVLNQDPGTTANPVTLFHRDNRENADFSVVLPAAIDEPTKFFAREMVKLPQTFAMVHSKLVVIDPMGSSPIVITGSHNLGPKASGKNDENLLIIRGAPGVARAYATNVMAIYNQYRWRFNQKKQTTTKRWRGLQDNDQWQKGYLKAGSDKLREMEFWT